MEIYQDQTSLKMLMGVYGTSSPSDQTFDLESYKDLIYAVYQFTESGKGVIPFISDVSSYYNVFTKLEWGKMYMIIIKPGTSSLTIPNLTVSSYENSGIIGKVCEGYTEREKDGYFYYSTNKMFKYAVYDGFQTFDIPKYMESVHKAVDTWEKIVKHPSDSNYQHELGIFFVDLVKEYGDDYIDVLAMASPEEFDKPQSEWKFGNTFPTYSQIIINIPNLDYMMSVRSNKGLDLYYSTILHELGHALGLNYYTMNEFQGTPVNSYTDSNDGKTKFYYYGDNALREYKRYFPQFNGLVGVPLDDNISAPRISAHWEEGPGQDSITRYINGILHPGLVSGMMTPYADEGETPLTKITIGFFEDYGYEVDYDLADEYGNMYNYLVDLKCNQSCSIYKIHDNTRFKRR